MNRILFPLCLLLLTVALAVSGCGGAGTSSFLGGDGTLAVRLADVPDPSIEAVHITVTRVQAHIDGQWQDVSTETQTVNLLDLVFEDTLLGQAVIPAGHYTQVRLFLSEATVTDADGTHQVVIPSAMQTGIKVNLNYTVNPNELTEILLDFNVSKSLVKQGNGVYRLQPVIPAVVKVLSGTITGSVTDDASQPLHNASVRAIYTAGDRYPLGTEVNATFTMDGDFKLWALLPGTYRLLVSHQEGGVTRTGEVTGVTVNANQNTDVGVIIAD
jgi:hypothetical protein